MPAMPAVPAVFGLPDASACCIGSSLPCQHPLLLCMPSPLPCKPQACQWHAMRLCFPSSPARLTRPAALRPSSLLLHLLLLLLLQPMPALLTCSPALAVLSPAAAHAPPAAEPIGVSRALKQYMAELHAPFLLRPLVKAAVLALFAGLFLLSCALLPRLER